MEEKKLEKLEILISKLDSERVWILKNIDKGRWPKVRLELAEIEREISKFILRAKDHCIKKDNS